MSALAIQNRKIEFVQSFLKIDDLAVISKLEELLLKTKHEQLQQHTSTPLTKKALNKIVDTAEDDTKKGKLTKAEDVLKQIEKWK